MFNPIDYRHVQRRDLDDLVKKINERNLLLWDLKDYENKLKLKLIKKEMQFELEKRYKAIKHRYGELNDEIKNIYEILFDHDEKIKDLYCLYNDLKLTVYNKLNGDESKPIINTTPPSTENNSTTTTQPPSQVDTSKPSEIIINTSQISKDDLIKYYKRLKTGCRMYCRWSCNDKMGCYYTWYNNRYRR